MKFFNHFNKKKFILGLFILTIILINTFSPLKINGYSMEPTLKKNTRVIVNKLYYIFKKPSRGDIIIFKLPDTKKKVVKRVIAIEGETIEIKNGKVFINDSILEEPYLKRPDNSSFDKRLIPLNYVFVLGDNRKISKDSRYDDIGFVPIKNIIGKVIFLNSD